MDSKSIFDIIARTHKEKKIVSLCNSLIKHCSFDSGKDAEKLCTLAYWLFVAGDDKCVLMIAQYTHSAKFSGKAFFNVWDYILYIWGLEIYLYTKSGELEAASCRISEFDKVLKTPLPGNYPSYELQLIYEQERRERIKYPDILNFHKIQKAELTLSKCQYKLQALYKMVGYTYTGLFPNLTEKQNKIEQYIHEYVTDLRKSL